MVIHISRLSGYSKPSDVPVQIDSDGDFVGLGDGRWRPLRWCRDERHELWLEMDIADDDDEVDWRRMHK